jgi:phosphoserine aminotransferase
MKKKPSLKPSRPFFSSGPCPKRPGWSANAVEKIAYLGRSHRAKKPLQQIKNLIDLTGQILELPEDYKIAIVPGSDTGAFELLMWSLLGKNETTMLVWESFGNDWAEDAINQLKLDKCKVDKAEYGDLPNLSEVSRTSDICFTWNGTTSGVRVPNSNWIEKNENRIVLCDATSAVFSQELDWDKLDAVSFSWQKVLGGEGGHGVIVLSPNAIKRLSTFYPERPLPKIFRLVKNGKLIQGVYEGETLNTPSMFCVADALDSLLWIKKIGGLTETIRRSNENFECLQEWVDETPWIENLVSNPSNRSNTSVCLKFSDERLIALNQDEKVSFVKKFVGLLEAENAAFDIKGHRNAPPGLRIWCGATINLDDIQKLLPWLEWCFQEMISSYSG